MASTPPGMAPGAADDGLSPGARLLHAAGRMLPYTLGCYAMIEIGELAGLGGGALTGLGVGLMAWTIAGAMHMLRPCLACAAEWPADGSAKVEARRGTLRAYHAMNPYVMGRFAGWYIGALMAATFACEAAGWHAGAALPQLAWAVTMGTVARVAQVHGTLQPWCPWCRHGGGGGHAPAPDPDPGAKLPA